MLTEDFANHPLEASINTTEIVDINVGCSGLHCQSPTVDENQPDGVEMTDYVLQSLEHGLLTITLNFPERRNALNLDVTVPLLEAAQRASTDPEVRAVLLKGAGGTFCVGGDVREQADPSIALRTFEMNLSVLQGKIETARVLHTMTKPTVAAVEGAAAGAGLSLALACDLRIVGETAKITTAFAKIALPGDFGGMYFLTKMLGSAKCRELYLMSPVLSGKEAHAMGMMTRVVPDSDVAAVAYELAMSLAQGPTVALGYMKKNINNAETCSLEACLDGEALHHCRCLQTTDHKEAAVAFLQKRAPAFVGS